MADDGEVLQQVEAALRAAFDVEPTRASVSFLGVEPIEVLRFASPGVISYVSLGMSRHPMSGADALRTDIGPRAELLIHVRDAKQAQEGVDAIWRQLAILAAAPSVEGVTYADGMTIDLGAPLVPGSRCTGGLVFGSELAPIEVAVGAVEIFRVLPATVAELAWGRARGVNELREKWRTHEVDLLDLFRRSVRLD